MKEFLKYFICYIGTFGGILALAMWALLLYGMHNTAQAGTIKYKTANHYDTADELFTVLLVKEQIAKHKCHDSAGTIDGCHAVIEISQLQMPNKLRIYEQ